MRGRRCVSPSVPTLRSSNTHTACQVKDRPGTPHRFRLMFTKNNTWVYCKMHRMLITAQQKYLSVGRVDISAPRPLSLGCPFIPGGASWELEGPTAFRCSLRCSSSGPPADTTVLWWLQGLLSSLGFLLLLLPEVAVVGTSTMSSGFTCLSGCIRGVPQDLSMVILHHLWRRVPLWAQSVQSSKTGPAIYVNTSCMC